MLGNISGSFWHAMTMGRFASSPVDHSLAKWYRQLHRYAQSFALVGDWTVAFLGGHLKRKQRISGRMADILSDLYLLSTVLKRFEDDGRIEEDIAVVEAIARDRIVAIERNFIDVFNNFPNFFLRNAMRFLVFPLGAHAGGSTDKENYRLARAVLRPEPLRERLTRGLYVSDDPLDRTGMLEDALKKVHRAEEVETKFVRAIKKGVLTRRLDQDAVDEAVKAGVLTADEASDRVIRVDDFAPGEFVRTSKLTRPKAKSAPKSAIKTKAKSKAVRKPAAKRKAAAAATKKSST
jgi:acyl-CoA dehydrogenase